MSEQKNTVEENVKVVSVRETNFGKKVINLQKGTATTTRLEHNAPSHMRSEE